MAANLQSFRLATIFGKRFVTHIPCLHSLVVPSLSLSLRRSVHVSVYDKNPEEHVRVADYVIPAQPENYWSPHPQTGVFGPAKDHKPTDLGVSSNQRESVLEQKAFFRPQEDLDKPLYA